METITPVKQFRVRGAKATRISSIDLLRGLIMVIMALDHTRDYFHAGAFVNDPGDLHNTTVLLFFTRWITHFCAPVFMLLAGVSAFISGRKKTKKELSVFLLTRGLWLIILGLTVVNFSWYFDIHFSYISFQVIGALGVCMLFLSGLIYLPEKTIAVIGFTLIAGHNLLDNFHVSGNSPAAFTWSILHEQGFFAFNNTTIKVMYPVVPWIGVMALGYCLGKLFNSSFGAERRKRILINLGLASIVLFIMLRYINGYGDSSPWSQQASPVFSFLSFINVTKYPPSLDYLLITIGPALIFLAVTENGSNRFTKIISTYGRVPMFYYLVHIYVIHLLAIPAAVFLGYSWTDMIFSRGIHPVPQLKEYGFTIPVVYGIWMAIVASLYPLCKWYDRYKTAHKEKWWLSYL